MLIRGSESVSEVYEGFTSQGCTSSECGFRQKSRSPTLSQTNYTISVGVHVEEIKLRHQQKAEIQGLFIFGPCKSLLLESGITSDHPTCWESPDEGESGRQQIKLRHAYTDVSRTIDLGSTA